MALTRAEAHHTPALMRALAQKRNASDVAREFLSEAVCKPTLAELRWLEAPSHHLVCMSEPRYPRSLHALARTPPALYIVGNPDLLNDAQLSIVGSRNPTPTGLKNAFDFAESLARSGLCITSGLAEGIDSAAHRGALCAQGGTIAVLGSGVDVIYPQGNYELSEHIRFQGALVSEFPLGTPPRRANFPQRNRLIATLSLGTLVVEAASRSGSLITAHLAGEHNKELFAIPGSIHSPLSRGCHELIRNGATLTEKPADILKELDFSAFFSHSTSASAHPEGPPGDVAGMDKDHKILLDALDFEPTDLDSLIDRTGFKAEAVSSMMLILELEGRVQAAPGGRYSRVVRSRGER